MNKTTILCAVGILALTTGMVFGASSSFKIQMESWSPYYQPEAASVSLGTVVLWENPTATHHTVTQDGCEEGGACLFDSGAIPPSGIFELPELPPGQYPYHCTLHPIMRGTVVVTGPNHPSEI